MKWSWRNESVHDVFSLRVLLAFLVPVFSTCVDVGFFIRVAFPCNVDIQMGYNNSLKLRNLFGYQSCTVYLH